MSHKRAAENQLTRDDDGEDHAEDKFITTPQIADQSEMATRRVVRVRRPEGTTSASSSGTIDSGFFKDAATAASRVAPAKPVFGFGFGANGSNGASTASANAFSFGATTTAPTKLTSGFPTTTTSSAPATSASSGFNSGLPSATTTTTATATAAPSSSSPSSTTNVFSFGAKTESNNSNNTSFSFGAAPPGSGDAAAAAKKPPMSFHFGLPANTTIATATESKPSAEAKEPTDDKKMVFGAGSFNFGTAVNTFVAALTKMQEEAKEVTTDGTAGAPVDRKRPGNDNNDDADEKPDPAGFGSEIVEQTERDVLATAPSKLYLFEKGEGGKAGRWAERGVGDAKLISQAKPGDPTTHIYRLLVRGGYSLNATIKKNSFSLSKTEAKHLILLVATVEGPCTFLLKFTGPSAEANTTKFSEELKKVLEEVSKAE